MRTSLVAVVEHESGFTFAILDDESWPIYLKREAYRLQRFGHFTVHFFDQGLGVEPRKIRSLAWSVDA